MYNFNVLNVNMLYGKNMGGGGSAVHALNIIIILLIN